MRLHPLTSVVQSVAPSQKAPAGENTRAAAGGPPSPERTTPQGREGGHRVQRVLYALALADPGGAWPASYAPVYPWAFVPIAVLKNAVVGAMYRTMFEPKSDCKGQHHAYTSTVHDIPQQYAQCTGPGCYLATSRTHSSAERLCLQLGWASTNSEALLALRALSIADTHRDRRCHSIPKR
jgi:hypothetical protein